MMAHVALDSNRQRISAYKATTGGEYYCQICHEKVFLKKGAIKAPHFSHYPNKTCTDTFHYEEMSQWHLRWQDFFPFECQEVILRNEGVTHRADVLIEQSKTVVEFQHSAMSSHEFDRRNGFYVSCGYRVVWVFDMLEEYQNEKIVPSERNKSVSEYSTSRDTFSNFEFKSKDVVLFFQSKDSENQGKIVLEHVKWVSPNGISRFVSESVDFSSFMAFCHGDELNREAKVDSIPYLWNRNNCRSLIVLNKNTDEKIMITKDPSDMLRKYHVVYGKREDSFGEFGKDSVPIPEAEDGIFKIVWMRKKDDPDRKK